MKQGPVATNYHQIPWSPPLSASSSSFFWRWLIFEIRFQRKSICEFAFDSQAARISARSSVCRSAFIKRYLVKGTRFLNICWLNQSLALGCQMKVKGYTAVRPVLTASCHRSGRWVLHQRWWRPGSSWAAFRHGTSWRGEDTQETPEELLTHGPQSRKDGDKISLSHAH